jgi:hypothetical protein
VVILLFSSCVITGQIDLGTEFHRNGYEMLQCFTSYGRHDEYECQSPTVFQEITCFGCHSQQHLWNLSNLEHSI